MNKMLNMAGNEESERFVIFSEQQIQDNNDGQANKNSIKNEEKAVKCLKLFLQANNVEDTDFFKYVDEGLDWCLAKFYWGVRTEKGEKYSSSTMHTIRYGSNRALQKSGKTYDITKKEYKNFLHSINSFENVLKDLKKCSKGTV